MSTIPIRGESIGTAYVRVRADGSGIPDDVRDAFNDADGKFDDAGSVGAKRYKEAFAKEMESHTGRSLDDSLSDALAKDDFADKFFDGPAWKKFETNMHARFGGLGDDAAKELRDKFTKQGSLDGIEDDVTRVVSRINANVGKAINEESRAAEAAKKAMVDFETNFRRVMDDTNALSKKVSGDNVSNLESVRRTLENMGKSVRGAGRDVDSTVTTVDRLTKALRRNNQESGSSATLFGRLGKTIDGIGDKTGAVFGKGSRNDFLNFTGSFVANSVKLLGVLPKVLDNVAQFGNGFRAALSDGQGFFKAISGGFTEMGKDADGAATSTSGLFASVGQLLISLPVLAGVILGVISVLSIVAALVSGLSAAIIALAGSISFAIVGAIAPLVGLLAPLAVGLGVVAAGIFAISQNSKALDTLKAKFKPLLDDVKSLGDTFVHGFLDRLKVNGATLEPVVKSMHDLFSNTGKEVGNIVDRFTNGFKSPEFAAFIDQVTLQVPRQLSVWSRIIQNIGRILGQLFIDLRGPVASFDSAVERITDRFADWLGSTKGKKAVLNFLDDAADSAQAVGGFLLSAVDLIGQLLQSGKGTGDDIFTSLGKQIDKFRTFLKEHPDGLADFFKNGKETADNIGKIALGIAEIFAALDSPEGRKNLQNVLDLLSDIGKLAGPISFLANDVIPTLTHALSPLADLKGLVGFVDGIAGAIARIGNIRLPNFDFISKIGPALAKVKDKIGNFFGNLGGRNGVSGSLSISPPSLAWIPGVLSKVKGFFRNVGHAADVVDFSGLTDKASAAARRVGTYFAAVPGKLRALAGQFTTAAATWGANILSKISDVPGEIVDYFRGLGSQIASAIGSIALHFSFPDPPSWVTKGLGGIGKFVDKVSHASGGIFDGAQFGIIGEAGAEAVVPLTGPLSQVDPSVRELSAIARGLKGGSAGGSNISTMPGKTINVEQNIHTVSVDPRAAASEFLNYLTAVVA